MKNGRKVDMMKTGIKVGLGILGAVIVIGGATYGVMSFEKIDTGRVGVVYSKFGGVKQETLPEGFHFINPLDSVKEFTIGNEQLILSKDTKEGSENDDSFLVSTSDNANIRVSFQMTYRFLPDKVVETYQKFKGMDGEDIINKRVATVLKSKISEVTSKYDLMDIYSGNRSTINNEITTYLNKELSDEYGIEVIDASIIDVHPDEQLEKSIKDRLTAMQNAEKAKADQETAKVEAETALIKAQNEADITREKADAEAYANQQLAKSITPELVDMKEAEARLKHGWVEIQGVGSTVVKESE